MAKNRTKKKKRSDDAMDVTEETVSEHPQAMDTSESGVGNQASGDSKMKVNKGRPMKRSKNVRMAKLKAKAISMSEKSIEKVSKHDSKKSRTQSAKLLYE